MVDKIFQLNVLFLSLFVFILNKNIFAQMLFKVIQIFTLFVALQNIESVSADIGTSVIILHTAKVRLIVSPS